MTNGEHQGSNTDYDETFMARLHEATKDIRARDVLALGCIVVGAARTVEPGPILEKAKGVATIAAGVFIGNTR